MFVDAGLLHSGADESRRAGDHAQGAADRLSRGPLPSDSVSSRRPRRFTTRPVRGTFNT
jgi:Protein of unknown function (DUF2563)